MSTRTSIQPPPSDTRQAATITTPARGSAATLSRGQVGALLGAWQRRELTRVRAFRECAGLGWEDLEDLYQDSAIALMDRDFESELHLRNALHVAIKHRALNSHRNRRRRSRILERAGRGQDALDHARQEEQTAEALALAQQDRFVVGEFLSELTALEGHVFRLLADGLGWRAAADALGRDRNEIRATARACERKRERFALLYTTGRLCGYRAHTIHALTSGASDSRELAVRARAHLRSCAHCRAEHRISAERLRAIFERDALALLPLPALVGGLPLLSRISARAHRLLDPLTSGPGGTLDALRTQLLSLVANSGATTKLAVSAVTVAVGTGGAISATQALGHHTPARRAHHPSTATQAPQAIDPTTTTTTTTVQRSAVTPAGDAPQPSGQPRPASHSARQSVPRGRDRPAQRAPSADATTTTSAPTTPANSEATAAPSQVGFAYLGVPHATPSPTTSAPASASAAASGGAFSP